MTNPMQSYSHWWSSGARCTVDGNYMLPSEDLLKTLAPQLEKARAAMKELEKGAIANPDENRMVGHYWLRNPEHAPNSEIANAIGTAVERIKAFALAVHQGTIVSSKDKKFTDVVVVGIGGSALGPQFLARALEHNELPCSIHFVDNTDPDGIEQILSSVPLDTTLFLVVSKSGGTKETRNGLIYCKAHLHQKNLDPAKHLIAITQPASNLDNLAREEEWLASFPIWDWVGGRTSLFSSVGLLPAALLGHDINALLEGAKKMDLATSRDSINNNPALMLAYLWYLAGSGTGSRSMVILPYKDRLELFSKYLQQLVMESLGKEHDLSGNRVLQGLTVFGNKGSTDQHAYVQQLRDGPDNFFACFIEVLKDHSPKTAKSSINRLEVEKDITASDYLHGFLLGTREALFEQKKRSLTITIPTVDEWNIGALVALFERAVGFYATLININAYHQPGVEAGKKAAGLILKLQKNIITCLQEQSTPMTAHAIHAAIAPTFSPAIIFQIVRRLAANGMLHMNVEDNLLESKFFID